MGSRETDTGRAPDSTTDYAACESDEVSFERFYRQHRARVCAVLAALTDETRYVEDAAQEALMSTRIAWSRVRDYDKPEAWTIKVAVRKLRSWHSRDRRQVPLTDSVTVSWSTPAHSEDQIALQQAFGHLSGNNAVVLYLHLLGYSTAEIAEILFLDINAVKTRLSRARKTLRNVLSEDAYRGGHQ